MSEAVEGAQAETAPEREVDESAAVAVPADLGVVSVQRAAWARLRPHLPALAVAYVLLCGPAYALSWSGVLDRIDPTWASRVLFAVLLLGLDAYLLLRLRGERGRSLARALPRLLPTLLIVRLLRRLLAAAVALSVVLLPPVLAWFWPAEAILTDEGPMAPWTALRRSRARVVGNTVEVFWALLPLGLPALAGTAALGLAPEGALTEWQRELANFGVDLLELALVPVAWEIHARLAGRPDSPKVGEPELQP